MDPLLALVVIAITVIALNLDMPEMGSNKEVRS